MRTFYNQQHRFYGGVDLHARTLALCVLGAKETIVRQQTIAAGPELVHLAGRQALFRLE
jgi:hypothetical protein